MLTGQRASEIAGLRWSEIVDDQIVLSPERTKNGKKHVVPISEPVRTILDGRPRRGDRDLIFGRHWNRPLTGWGTLKAKLDQRLGSTVTNFVHHDLRRTMVTRMAEKLRIMPHIIEAVVNHVGGHKAGVAGVYNRADYPEQTRQALTAWGEHLLAIVEGRAVPDKVVQLRA
jgi:integrase